MPVPEPAGVWIGGAEQEPRVLDPAGGEREGPRGGPESAPVDGDDVRRSHRPAARVRLQAGDAGVGEDLHVVRLAKPPSMEIRKAQHGTRVHDAAGEHAGGEIERVMGEMWPAPVDVVEAKVAEPAQLLGALVERQELVPADRPAACRDPFAALEVDRVQRAAVSFPVVGAPAEVPVAARIGDEPWRCPSTTR